MSEGRDIRDEIDNKLKEIKEPSDSTHTNDVISNDKPNIVIPVGGTVI